MAKPIAIVLGLWVAIALFPLENEVKAGPSSKKTIVPEVPANKDVGFTSIFDGKTLKGWDANPKIWRVENGLLVGELTADNQSPGWTKTPRFAGGNHGGKRQFLALPGQLTQLVDGEVPRLIGTLDNSTKINAILGDGWVETHIIAKGNVLIHITNGHVTSVVLDDDEKNRPKEGVLALHAHPGPPMKVEFRDIRLKSIAP